MIRQPFFATTVLLLLIWMSGCARVEATATGADAEKGAHEDPEGYYTCSMHPQVHQHEPGKCPICGMELVKVSGKNRNSDEHSDHSARGILASDEQLSLAGVGKYTVRKKDLIFAIPVSGRILSSREVAFQVFESDLQLIKAGATFSGALSASPDEELSGKIHAVDTILDPSSRTVRAIGVLSQTLRRVLIDGSFHGEITVTENQQLAIPESAVLHTGEGHLVYLFSAENKLMPVRVTLGSKAQKEYQVLSGLSEGDVISTGPNFLLDSEAKIRGGGGQAHH